MTGRDGIGPVPHTTAPDRVWRCSSPGWGCGRDHDYACIAVQPDGPSPDAEQGCRAPKSLHHCHTPFSVQLVGPATVSPNPFKRTGGNAPGAMIEAAVAVRLIRVKLYINGIRIADFQPAAGCNFERYAIPQVRSRSVSSVTRSVSDNPSVSYARFRVISSANKGVTNTTGLICQRPSN